MTNLYKPFRQAFFSIGLLLCCIQLATAQVNVTASGGTPGPTTYTTLKLAFDAINAGTHTGMIQLLFTANTTETASAVLNASGTGSASYSSILIQPSGQRSITGNLANLPLIDLNGADNVTINGLDNGTDALTLVNQATSTTTPISTIRFVNGAQNNLIQNCIILGAGGSLTSGTVLFHTSNTGQGNSNNLVQDCTIGPLNSTSTHRIGVFSVGTTGAVNTNNTIQGCDIFDFHNSNVNIRAGVYWGNSTTACTVTGCSFYQTASRSMSSATYAGVYILSGGTSYVISNNYIGGSQPQCGGTPTTLTTSPLLQAIYVSADSARTTYITGNTIANISVTTNTTSIIQSIIHFATGQFDIGYNTIGSATVNGSISVSQTTNTSTFSVFGSGSGYLDSVYIHHNTAQGINIGGASSLSLRGVDMVSAGATFIIDSNTFGHPTQVNSWLQSTPNNTFGIINRSTNTSVTHQFTNNIFANIHCNTSRAVAIFSTPATQNCTISGNTIFKLSSGRNNNGSGGTSAVVGIQNGSNSTITDNTIYGLNLMGTGVETAIGIYLENTNASSQAVRGNLIHSLMASTDGSNLIGIHCNSGNYTLSNNMIRLGLDTTGANITLGHRFYGIYDLAGNHNIVFNSVYIGGTGVASTANNTYALFAQTATTQRSITNNLFVNRRSNAASTGKHYSAVLASPSFVTMNYNDYYTGPNFLTGNGTADYTSLSAWQAFTLQDVFSLNTEPNFINPTGSSSTIDLHINTALTSLIESAGTTFASLNTDIDGDSRPGPAGSVNGGGTAPDMGADEFDGIPQAPCVPPTAGTVSASADTLCFSGSTTLTMLGVNLPVGGTYTFQWQNSLNGTTFSNIANATDTIYNTPTLNTNTYYRCVVSCLGGGAASNSNVQLVVVASPSVASTSPGAKCGPGSVTLAATGNGTLSWYDAVTAGNLVGSGASFNTPVITSSSSFYVQASIGLCNSTRTAVVASINPFPVVTITGGNTPVCAGQAVTLTGQGANTYNWSPTISNGVAFFPTSSQTYTLIGTNTFGCRDTAYAAVSVNPLPTVDAGSAQTLCAGQPLTLSASGTPASYTWNNNITDGQVFYPTSSAVYNVTATSAQGCTATDFVIVGVNPAPSVSITGPSSICFGDSLTLSASGAVSYNWSNGLTNGQTFAPTQTDTYTVTGTGSNGCTDTAQITVQVGSALSVSISGPTQVCAGSSITLAGAGALSYSWDNNVQDNVAFTPNASATYNVTGTDANGCTGTAQISVVVDTLPSISASGPAQVCAGNSITLAGAGAQSYSWDNNVQDNVAFTASASTTYNVTGTDANGCTGTAQINLTVNPLPTPSISVNGNTMSTPANPGSAYQWLYFGNPIMMGGNTDSLPNTQAGTYTVVETTAAGCSATSAAFNFVPVGLQQNEVASVQIYPNPADQQIQVIGFEGAMFNFSIINSMGQAVAKGTATGQVDLSAIPAGCYLLRVQADGLWQQAMFVKQ